MPISVAIVEDNVEICEMLTRTVERASSLRFLQSFSSGEEALEKLPALKPDVVIMDIQLPEVSGLEVTKWLKQDESLRAIPVIAVTAFAMKGDEERIREGGCEAYISKPISVMHFLDTVRRHLG